MTTRHRAALTNRAINTRSTKSCKADNYARFGALGSRRARILPKDRLSRSNPFSQFIWYLGVGGCSFIIDVIVFSSLIHLLFSVTSALVAGFVAGTFVNYVLSRTFAFTGGRHSRAKELTSLIMVAILGLALTWLLVMLLMWVGLTALAAKVVATPLALIWNFYGRRIFVFHADMPMRTWQISAKLHAQACALSLDKRRGRDG